jgi:hypothetical protein
MTRWSGRTGLWTGAGIFLAALALLLASPAQPEAASASCGDNSGDICWENESCVDILFYDQCTTEYKYYPQSSTGGGGAASGLPDDAGALLQGPSGDGCTWGQDYLGWEPRGC